MKMKKFNIIETLIIAGLSVLFFAQTSLAAVSAEEAKQLGTTLTKFGAEKAGNKDGSIPPYTGGLDNVPGYDPKTSDNYINPFADEKPLYSVNAKNMQQYEDLLLDGIKQIMHTSPDYRIDVYPTHRTARYQDWVIENTLKNSTTAHLAGKVMGDTVAGAAKDGYPFPGVPFPIPKDGYEVMWNHKLRYGPCAVHNITNAYLVDTAGNVSNLPSADCWHLRPWYDTVNELRGKTFDAVEGFNCRMTYPPASAGLVFLNLYSVDTSQQRVWFYTPGQRRVRVAPEFSYDVPISSYGGCLVWDELFGFVGRMDRFDFKLVGKKEMLVPYNCFDAKSSILEEILGKHYLKPERMRYEKHRVWVVEATRKPDARHVYSRRTFYVDEDSWSLVAADSYDDADKLYRYSEVLTYPAYDIGGVNTWFWVTYDLIKGNYFIINLTGGEGKSVHSYESSKGLDINLTPASIGASGIR